MSQPTPPPVDRRTTSDISAQVQALLVRYMSKAAAAGIGTGWQGFEQINVGDALGRVLYDDVVVKDASGNDHVVRAGTLIDDALARLLAGTPGLSEVTVVKLTPPPDAGQALIGIFAHLAGVTISRLNQTPDKAFLAFLDLIGVRAVPPHPARVPLTFSLAAGATVDAPVPAGTRVAATLAEGERDPPVFATTSEIFLTGAALVAAFVRDPLRDAWSDLSDRLGAGAVGTAAPGLPIFRGDRPIERRLWLAHAMFAGQAPRDLNFEIVSGPDGQTFPDLEWERFDGSAWQPLPAPTRVGQDGTTRLTFAAVPPVPVGMAVPANGGAASSVSGAWIGARLPRAIVGDATFTLPATWVTAIRVSSKVERSDLLPDAVLSGAVAVDWTTDFLPFGERPKLGDVFLLACEGAFADTGPGPDNKITLTIKASNLPDGRLPLPDPNATPEKGSVTLAWEYWNGSRWRSIGQSNQTVSFIDHSADYDSGLDDSTLAFTAMEAASESTVTFRPPPDWATSTVGSRTAHWLRVRIAGGDYGHDAHYTKTGDTYELDPSTLRPPSLNMVTFAYRYVSPLVAPEHVLVEADFALAEVTPTLAPGGAGFALFPAFDDSEPALYLAFVRPGAPTAFANQRVTLYAGIDEISYDEVRNAGRAPPTQPPAVAWEYAARDGWGWLGAQDETSGFTRSGLVSFIGPPDLVATYAFGRAAFWLRASLESGVYARPPRLNRLVTNTVWATQATEILGEVIGSGTAEPDQQLTTSQRPVLTGQVVEITEPEMLSKSALAALVAEEGPDCVTVVPGSGPEPQIRVRWHEVIDFYGSAPGSRHYTLDRLAGVITFGGRGRGRMPPRGTNNIRITYSTGGGAIGNRPAGTVTQLKSAVPYVEAVTNLVESGGGADAEDLSSVRRRGPTVLRHRHRAVAVADYEDLAFEASPAVARAKGLPAHDAATAGRVELVVVPRSSVARPVPSQELLVLVRDYVSGRAPPTVDLTVRGPDWVAVSVAVGLTPMSFEHAMEVRIAVITALDGFLHPLTGGFDHEGWPFGRGPHRSDLLSLIETVPGVDYVQTLTTITSPDLMTFGDHMLLYSGDHQVTLLAPAHS
jgi:Baseplate J-like protein